MIDNCTKNFSNKLESKCGGILWNSLKPTAPTRITQELLSEIQLLQQNLIDNFANNKNINFQVLCSDIPNIFSLGGDLEHFCHCARNKDSEALHKYARESVDLVYKSATNYFLPITTIALVEGMAMGGGFEMALSANYIIAEEQAIFSFPETRFGLFPGMGAYTLLRQRVSNHLAEEIIYSGSEYTAKELFKLNVIDHLAKKGKGKEFTRKFIKKRHRRHQAIHNMRKIVQQSTPIDRQELYNTVDYWVECVMNLNAKQLRLIDVLSKTSL